MLIVLTHNAKEWMGVSGYSFGPVRNIISTSGGDNNNYNQKKKVTAALSGGRKKVRLSGYLSVQMSL